MSNSPQNLEGAIVLVGVTRERKDGTVTQEQYSGVASVERFDEMSVVNIHCDDGEVRNYPVDEQTLEVARPGEYRLRSTGKIIVDPHYLITWIVKEALDS